MTLTLGIFYSFVWVLLLFGTPHYASAESAQCHSLFNEAILDTNSFDGVPIKLFETPADHDAGATKSGLFRIFRDGDPRLLKIFFKSDTGLSPKTDAWFVAELNGMKLGEKFGGPKIYGSGSFKTQDGKIGFYIEITEFFHGERSFTLKGVYRRASNDLGFLLDPWPSGSYVRQIAELYSKVVERKISTDEDVDLIFSEGKVGFIDTAGWKKYDAGIDPMLLIGPLSFVRKIKKNSLAETQFITYFGDSILASRHLTTNEKIELLEAFHRALTFSYTEYSNWVTRQYRY